jgi:hypothetical protein
MSGSEYLQKQTRVSAAMPSLLFAMLKTLMFEHAMADDRGKVADCPIELRAMLRLRNDGKFFSANLTDAGVATLANSLSRTETLISFHLDDCNLTAYQLQVFSRSLPGSKISDLSLKISLSPLVAQLEALSNNPLTSLCVALQNLPRVSVNNLELICC